MKEGIVLELKDEQAIILTPAGEFISIHSEAHWKVGQSIFIPDELTQPKALTESKISNKRSMWKKKNVWIGLVASLLIFFLPLSLTSQASVFVTIDINPSLELEVKDQSVIDVRYLNQDGKYLLSQMRDSELNGTLDQVTSHILEKAKQLGYLKQQEDNVLMVGILDNKGTFEVSKYKETLERNIAAQQIDAEVIILNTTEKEEKKLADQKGVSLGKLLLQEKEKENGNIISDDQLKKENVRDILKKGKEEKEKQNKHAEQVLEKVKEELEEKINKIPVDQPAKEKGPDKKGKSNKDENESNDKNKKGKEENVKERERNHENDKGPEDKKPNHSPKKPDDLPVPIPDIPIHKLPKGGLEPPDDIPGFGK